MRVKFSAWKKSEMAFQPSLICLLMLKLWSSAFYGGNLIHINLFHTKFTHFSSQPVQQHNTVFFFFNQNHSYICCREPDQWLKSLFPSNSQKDVPCVKNTKNDSPLKWRFLYTLWLQIEAFNFFFPTTWWTWYTYSYCPAGWALVYCGCMGEV